MTEAVPALRLDKWLFFTRFFKTRADAARALTAGKIRHNGTATTKAHANARVGDTLVFVRGRDVVVIRVLGLPNRRGPAPEAQTFYERLEQQSDGPSANAAGGHRGHQGA